jgi:serine/threonine protein phosphatase PrpC
LAAEADDRRAAQALVDAALAAGGHDNVTVIVATV